MYNNLLEDKYYWDHFEEDFLQAAFDDRPRNCYGFIAIKNPDYLQDKWDDDEQQMYEDVREYIYRKPTAAERREIVINTIIQHNGKHIRIKKLAALLAVSDRTIQTLLKSLQAEGLIEIIPAHGKKGAQKANAYRYIGPACEFYGSGLDLKLLYDPHREVGFRRWAWRTEHFEHDNKWHNEIYLLCKLKFDERIARRKYLEERGLPLIAPDNIRYLVLRYSYWKGHNKVIHNAERPHLFEDLQISKDGTIRIELKPEKKSETVKFFDYELELVFTGEKTNPIVEIYNHETNELLGTFSWFYENVISSVKEIDDDHTEQFFILGDFTTK